MTVYVVPCGVSILDGLVAKKDDGPPNVKPGRLVKRAEDLGRGVLARPDADVVAWWKKQAGMEAADAMLPDWDPRAVSAETNTLAGSSGLGRLGAILDRQDRVLLLASDTPRGVAAALCVAQHIDGLALPDVAWLTTPEGLAGAPLGASLAPGTLTVVRLRGLDPRHGQGGFIEAVAGTGWVLRAAFDVGEAVEVHLTGGYKATLLHTLAMTELLYSLDPGRVSARYMFEDTGTLNAEATPIGMRRFSQVDCDDMRDELAGVRDGKRHEGARTFEGLAWTEEGGLNAFGYGYLAVLGERLIPGRPGPVGP